MSFSRYDQILLHLAGLLNYHQIAKIASSQRSFSLVFCLIKVQRVGFIPHSLFTFYSSPLLVWSKDESAGDA